MNDTNKRRRKNLRFLSNISPEAMSASSLASLAAVAITKKLLTRSIREKMDLRRRLN